MRSSRAAAAAAVLGSLVVVLAGGVLLGVMTSDPDSALATDPPGSVVADVAGPATRPSSTTEDPITSPQPGEVGFLGDVADLRVVDGAASAPPGTSWQDGTLVVTGDGVVLDGVLVAGSVSLQSAGTLTVRDSVVEARSGWMVLHGNVPGCHIDVQDSTLRFVGTPDNGSAAIHGDCTLDVRRNDISGSADGVQVGPGDSVVQQNYIHDLAATRDFHNDGVQLYSGSGLVVSHNRIDIGWNGTNQNAAIFFQGQFDAPVIEGNHLSGGGFTLRLEEGVAGAVVRDNVINAAPNAFGEVLVAPGAVSQWRDNVDGAGEVLLRP
ncbi:right-handed parallel beta-helix repeat-containing protein [Aquipuribacter sp. MA13-6]|uniref:right-handed parallel beta-helix repeat-containing protein n=1 Tax=unclassified Aquipuribacter TaxID=2635084 RepID=UPI003EEC02D2